MRRIHQSDPSLPRRTEKDWTGTATRPEPLVSCSDQPQHGTILKRKVRLLQRWHVGNPDRWLGLDIEEPGDRERGEHAD
jgi:hypothetical protein